MARREDFGDKLGKLSRAVSKESASDVVMYIGDMEMSGSTTIQKWCATTPKRNVVLLLATFGGDAHSAYRIARALRRHAAHFTVFVPVECKSAGTLLAIGADEIVMADCAELGPLDAQLRKPDEVGERSSGLTIMQALSTLESRSASLFTEHFLNLRQGSQQQISTKMALEVAAELTSGLLRPVYAQVDPMRLGEIDRSVKIAMEYGERLIPTRRSNLRRQDGLAALVGSYPSHSFVIDIEEAKDIFRSVRLPTPAETALAAHLGQSINRTIGASTPLVVPLPSALDSTSKPVKNSVGGTPPGPRKVVPNAERRNESRGEAASGAGPQSREGDSAARAKPRERRVAELGR